jgi:hypothetical protein
VWQVVAAIAGVPSGEALQDGLERIGSADLAEMRSLFRRMGLS